MKLERLEYTRITLYFIGGMCYKFHAVRSKAMPIKQIVKIFICSYCFRFPIASLQPPRTLPPTRLIRRNFIKLTKEKKDERNSSIYFRFVHLTNRGAMLLYRVATDDRKWLEERAAFSSRPQGEPVRKSELPYRVLRNFSISIFLFYLSPCNSFPPRFFLRLLFNRKALFVSFHSSSSLFWFFFLLFISQSF